MQPAQAPGLTPYQLAVDRQLAPKTLDDPKVLMHAMLPLALDDLLVLDLTHYIAGPYCTKLLADYGARVIKIERLDGDPCRRLGPFPDAVPHVEKSGLFLHLNTNKESVTLNLKTLRGRQLLFQLVAKADILVENFHPRVLPALGLDYPMLRQANPRLLLTSISNFGQTGPYRNWRAQDLTLYAMGGEMYSSGAAEREPLKQAHGLTLYQGGSVAAAATMIGLFGVRRHNIGQHIDLALFEIQAGSIDRRLTSLVTYQYNSSNPGPGIPSPVGIMPSGIYPCKDGYVDIRTQLRWWDRLVTVVADLEATIARLEQAGGARVTELDGGSGWAVADPDGNVIEVIQRS